jgi:UDP-GlcNAc:undecaprenyl-phosphate GlcNAc-1-phosphate transferase
LKELLTALPVALAAGAALSYAASVISRKSGFLDRPGTEAHKQQKAPVPYGGGLAVILAIVAGLLAVGWVIPEDTAHKRYVAVFAGAAVLLLVGMWDDIRRIRPVPKVLLELAVFIPVIVLGDVRITLFVPSYTFSIVVTLFWMMAVTNAFNLIDNHDGLAAGVGAIGAFFLALVCVMTGDTTAAVVLAAMAGGMLGFLLLNFPPAKIYLGDAGTLPLGFLLASMGIIPSFYHSGILGTHLAVLAPVFVLAVPLFDTTRVMLVRVLAGVNPFTADRRHFSHRLADLGLSPKAVAGVHYLFAGVAAAPAVVLVEVGLTGALVLLAQLFGTLLLILIVERASSGRR